MEYYTTYELSQILKYKTRRTFLQALHYNQQNNQPDEMLTKLFKCKKRAGKKFLFDKKIVDEIINS